MFKSKAQVAKIKKLEAAGKVKPGTTKSWLKVTKDPARLPERKHPKKGK